MAGLFIVSFLILLKITYRNFSPVAKQSAKQIPLSQDTCSSRCVFMRGKYLGIMLACSRFHIWMARERVSKGKYYFQFCHSFFFSCFIHCTTTEERKVLKNLHNCTENMLGQYFSFYIHWNVHFQNPYTTFSCGICSVSKSSSPNLLTFIRQLILKHLD